MPTTLSPGPPGHHATREGDNLTGQGREAAKFLVPACKPGGEDSRLCELRAECLPVLPDLAQQADSLDRRIIHGKHNQMRRAVVSRR